jgi:orotidine-5'-phosphate decarboxylase/orotate phosphoribosyltransferase
MRKLNDLPRVCILPFDGYESTAEWLRALTDFISDPEAEKMLAYVKINDAVHNLDAGGPAIVAGLSSLLKESAPEVGIFLDLKIYDVSATIINTIRKYSVYLPTILTVCSNVAVETLIKLRLEFPNVKLAMVSMLTDIAASECSARFGQLPAVKIYNDLMNIKEIYFYETGKRQNWHKPGCNDYEPFDMIVCSPHEVEFLKKNLPDSYQFIVPGIRDEWMKKEGDHQKRTTGVAEALDLGADFVVMGAQLVKGNPERGVDVQESREKTRYAIRASQRYLFGDNPLDVLKMFHAYYISRKNENGRFVGPLVAYAGTYAAEGGEFKNYVGFEYFNFAKVESRPDTRAYFAEKIIANLIAGGFEESSEIFLGAPMGGIMLATEIGSILHKKTIFAEKKVVSLNFKKEISELVISRHDLDTGDNVVIVEDVCNNFSTTEKLQMEIKKHGGVLKAIVCAVNRAGVNEWNGIPVISALFIPTQQFKQEDPEAFVLIVKEKIHWNPKKEWDELIAVSD